jgi:hypothetical protein
VCLVSLPVSGSSADKSESTSRLLRESLVKKEGIKDGEEGQSRQSHIEKKKLIHKCI